MDTAFAGPSMFPRGKVELSAHASALSAFVMHQMSTTTFAFLNALPVTADAPDCGGGTTSKPGGVFDSTENGELR